LALYSDFAGLLGDPTVDLVDLCVPNEHHGRMAVEALRAGKAVLVEKPIALTLEEADSMVAEAREAGKPLLVGQVLPFVPEFAFVLEAVRSGRYGALRAAHLTRVISKPDWSSDLADPNKSGGPAIDLHIHDTHFISLLCGVPRAVHSRGVIENGAVVHLTTQYLYDEPNLAVSCVSGALSQNGRPFTHGFEVYLDNATISFNFANLAGEAHVAMPLSVIRADGRIERPELGSGDPVDGFVRELTVASQVIVTGQTAPELSGELARQALALCLAEVQSVRTGCATDLG
jgi:predicted dehydrogenase